MYVLYSIFLFLAVLLYFPFYAFRIKVLKRERIHLLERLGFGLRPSSASAPGLWIHAVSVGEVLSLRSLVQELRKRHPSWDIHFSSLTNTGIRVARDKLGEVDHIFFSPLDFAWVVRKFFRAIQPRVFILAESEFWPNLLHVAKKQDIPVLLVNGRVSIRSFARYGKLKPLSRRILSQISLFLVQTETDKRRLEHLEVGADRIRIVGNLKAEVHLPIFAPAEISQLRESLKIAREKKVVVAGSTRKGEEEILLEAYREARRTRPDLLLIIAPRHPERLNEVEKICRNYEFRVARRTEGVPLRAWDILILDTIGELAQFYALGDLAFIGGSLVPWGGHNLLEPAFYEKPVFFGPHMQNFAYLADLFVQAGAARTTHQGEELLQMFLMVDDQALKTMGRKAKEVLDSLQGVTEKTIRAIEFFMDQTRGRG